VKVSRLPDMHVYVRSYGGWMMSVSDWINTRRLAESLDSVGASYPGDYHYAVGYDRYNRPGGKSVLSGSVPAQPNTPPSSDLLPCLCFSPMKMNNRHNEVWFVVKGEPVCPAPPKAAAQ